MTARRTEQELTPGTRLLDRYVILDRIGSGGMANIYRANDDRLDRVVCVKLLRTSLDNDGGTTGGQAAIYQATYDHFLKEALALSRLSHPNTLRIYDFGFAAGTALEPGAPFHVSEYLDGGVLDAHVRMRGSLGGAEVMSILAGITGAVAEAHEQGIIHRDIKPSNILFARVRSDLVPKLADFGIAHGVRRRTGADVTGAHHTSTVALFSPRWAAPEQLSGSPEGPRTDVYALGLVATFMLTGCVLFGDDDVSTTFEARARGNQLVASRLAALGFPPHLQAVLGCAMAVRPEDRMPSAPELLHVLGGALEVRPGPRAESQPPPSMVPPSQAHPSIGTTSQTPPASTEATFRVEVSVPQPARGRLLPERVVKHGNRRVRIVDVHERLDLSFTDAREGPVRLRVTLLPSDVSSLQVKGLTCFVARKGGRPTPALTVNEAQAEVPIDVMSTETGRTSVLGELSWSFGQRSPDGSGRVFLLDGRPLLIAYAEAQQAAAVSLRGSSDIVVMCRR